MGRQPSFTHYSLTRTSVKVIQYKHRFSLNTPHILFQIVKLHVSSLHMDHHHQASYKKSMRKCIFCHTLGLWDLKICRFYICWGAFQNIITVAIVCVCVCVCIFGLFRKTVKKRLLASSCLSVRPEHLGSQLMDFHEIWYLCIFRKYVGKNLSFMGIWQDQWVFTWRPMWICNNISLNSF